MAEQIVGKIARLAAMAQLGPLGGALFLGGSALASKVFASTSSDSAKAAADVLTELVGGSATGFLKRAYDGFRGDARNGDIERSMQAAALQALAVLRAEPAAAEFQDWFKDWHDFLAHTPPEAVFMGTGDADSTALQYDDDEFRAHWWSRMEPTMLRWRKAENSAGVTVLGLSSARMPEQLRMLLRARLPETLQAAHDHVLRGTDFERSWKAQQQHFQRRVLNDLEELKKAQRPAIAGAVWNIPRPTNHYQDRPDLIAQIDLALARDNVTALTALHGLGGIGKTQLARAYAAQRKDRYALGVWLAAENELTLLASLSAVAPLLGVAVEQNQRDMAIRVLARICAHGKPWLVVFDNAESAEALREWVEPLAGHGHVLITSRSENWGALAQPVSVTQWSEEESVRFLLARTGQRDRDVAAKLAEDLGWLALALEHAAAYMSAGDGMPMAEYRRVWKERLARTPAGDAYGRSVAASIGLSLDRVMEESPAGYELLSVLAWLAPDRIPKAELLEAGGAKLPEAVRAVLADRDAWNDLVELVGGRFSLLRRERLDGVVTGYYMHRVVQQVMRERLKADRPRWFEAACDVVWEAFPSQTGQLPSLWPACEALLPHVRLLRGQLDADFAQLSAAGILNDAGLYLYDRGLFVEARDFLELALASVLRQFGPDHPEVAANRSNLAGILGISGEYQAAREQIELALASDLRQFGPDHPNVAVSRWNLANILGDLGEHQAAREQIELALASELRQFGPDNLNVVAVRRSNLSNNLRALGEHQAAREQIELALASDLRQFGPDHPNVATHRSNLSIILLALWEHEAAREQIELALASDLRQFGPDHPSVARCRSNLAAILSALGGHQAALTEIDQALEIFRKKLPPEHPYIRQTIATRESILERVASAK